MASTYPTTLDTFPTNHANDVGEAVSATDINNLASGVNKIEAELGTDPSGSYSTVKARVIGGESRWVPLHSVAGFVPNGTTGGCVLRPGSAPLPANLTWSGAKIFYWANAEFALTGLTTKWQVRATLLTNGSSSVGDMAFGVIGVSTSGGSSGVVAGTFGTDSGSQAAYGVPATNSRLSAVGAEVTAPGDGFYAFYFSTTGTMASAFYGTFDVTLRARNT